MHFLSTINIPACYFFHASLLMTARSPLGPCTTTLHAPSGFPTESVTFRCDSGISIFPEGSPLLQMIFYSFVAMFLGYMLPRLFWLTGSWIHGNLGEQMREDHLEEGKRKNSEEEGNGRTGSLLLRFELEG